MNGVLIFSLDSGILLYCSPHKADFGLQSGDFDAMQLSATLFALYKAAGCDKDRVQLEEISLSCSEDNQTVVSVYSPVIQLMHQGMTSWHFYDFDSVLSGNVLIVGSFSSALMHNVAISLLSNIAKLSTGISTKNKKTGFSKYFDLSLFLIEILEETLGKFWIENFDAEVSESLCILLFRQEDLHNLLVSCKTKQTSVAGLDGITTLPPIAVHALRTVVDNPPEMNDRSPSAIDNPEKVSVKSNAPTQRSSKWRQWRASINTYMPNVRFRRRQTTSKKVETESPLSQTVSFQTQQGVQSSEKLPRVSTETDLQLLRNSSESTEKHSCSVPYLDSRNCSNVSRKPNTYIIQDQAIILGNKNVTTEYLLSGISSSLGYKFETDNFADKFSFILSNNVCYFNESINFSVQGKDRFPGAEHQEVSALPQDDDNKRVWLINFDGMLIFGTAKSDKLSTASVLNPTAQLFRSINFSRTSESTFSAWVSLAKSLLILKSQTASPVIVER